MTNLRQGRGLGSVFAGRSPILFSATALVCSGLVLPGALASTPLTHTHRALPTALHSPGIAETGRHSGGKHAKAAGKSRVTAHSAAAPAADTDLHQGGKRKKGRKGRQEPVEAPPIPMYRAQYPAAPVQHGHSLPVRNGHGSHGGRAEYGPAPLVSGNRHGARPHMELVTADHRVHPAPESRPAHAGSVAVASKPAVPRHEIREPDPDSTVKPLSGGSAAFAQGISHPEDDERLPRDRAVMGEDAPASPAPVARVSAAPLANATAPQAPPPVVQGFGSEIAVPTPSMADRPGGTRRRPHPSNWQPEALVSPPEPLEEREAITYAAISPAVLPEIYDHNGRLVMPAPLKGSHDVLVHQNLMANSDGLERIYDDSDLERMRAAHLLIPFPVSESLRVNEDLPSNRRVARPWTVMFAADIGRAFFQRFHQPLQVNSAVRTVRYQARLQMVNGNAAAISGDAASPHLTGQAIDFGKRGLTQAEMAWMRGYLLPMMQSGKIDVEEEFQQACFHISVYRSYALGRRSIREVAQVHAATNEAASENNVDVR